MQSHPRPATNEVNSADLLQRYIWTRQFTESLCDGLSAEDCLLQSMPDASPIRWHLAHTTWFFETFLLTDCAGYRPFHTDFSYLFNSYYNAVGQQYPRNQRGLISRPPLSTIWDYRRHVDEEIGRLLDQGDLPHDDGTAILELGIQHEQQHQELMLTDLKHAFFHNPIFPSYQDSSDDRDRQRQTAPSSRSDSWLAIEEGIYEIGHQGDSFCFDNEQPRHRVFLESYSLNSDLVTSRDYLDFMEDGGYSDPAYWLSLGWATINENSWRAPLYWVQRDGQWCEFTLAGLRPLELDAPVTHISYFEADAFARWSHARLPTEFEWEVAATRQPIEGNFVDTSVQQVLHPAARHNVPSDGSGLNQVFGDVWEWTSSAFSAYPGFQASEGALGEYNGKFMCNQFVLRGGSCATSSSHIRPTYRNFFSPAARWQFSGIRLAR